MMLRWINLLALMFTFMVCVGQAQASVERVTYFHLNTQGSPVAATDESGDLLWKEVYEPYGKRMLKEGTGENDHWFTGKREEDGLVYMGARWYSPDLARFLSMDPVDVDPTNPHTFNRYAYANNNPYRYVDPNGESALDIGFLIWDLGKLGVAVYTGQGVGEAVADVAGSIIDVVNPIPGGRFFRKAFKEADKAIEAGQAASKVTKGGKTYQTYTKTNPKTGEVYSGRTSGAGTPEQNLARRDANHHMNDQGYGPAVLDKSSANSAAIRGREQQLTQANGGAKSTGGTSGNAINGVSASNPKGPGYRYESYKEFGE